MTNEKARPVAALYFHSLAGSGGGAERMVLALAEGLAERGWFSHILTWDGRSAESFYGISDRVKWHRLEGKFGVTAKFKRTFTMARRLKEIKAQVLVGFVMSGDRTVLAAAKLSCTRLVAAERNAPSMYRLRYGPIRRAAAFATLGLADAVTVQFPRFVEEYPVSLRQSLQVIPNPVQGAVSTADPSRPDKDGRFRLLCVGRLDALQKRPTLLFDAFLRVADRHPNWDLLFVGDGPEAGVLEARIATAGLAERVKVMRSTTSIDQVYAKAHLFGTTSLWEGFPNALAEAMAAGLPVVGFSGCDGVVDLIEKAGGWLVPGCHDAIAFSQVLDEAMTSADLRVFRGTQAREAIKDYSAQPIFDRWSELLSTFCEAR